MSYPLHSPHLERGVLLNLTRNKWTRIASMALAATLLGGIGSVALETTGVTQSESASAHTTKVEVKESCLDDGTRLATYTGSTTSVPASGSGHTAVATIGSILPAGTKVDPVKQTVVGNTSYKWTQIVPASATSASATASLVWGDGHKESQTGSIKFTLDCGPKKDATATVDVKDKASCLDASTVSFGITNAEWNDKTPDLSVGDHTRTATAAKGHLFGNGTSTITVKYTIKAADPSLCPEDADATVKTKHVETCLDGSTVDFDLKFASWNTAADLSVGTHERTATADKGHLFNNGKSTITVEYTIKAADPSLCPEDASATVKLDQKETCYASSTVAFDLKFAHLADGEVIDTTVGTHTVTFESDKDHFFDGHVRTFDVTYTITAADPSLCPQDAVATVDLDQNETCLSGTIVKDTLKFATWDAPLDLSVGTHTATATASTEHLFGNGTAHISVTYTIKAADPSLCPHEASASAFIKSQQSCYEDSTVGFTLAHATWESELDLTVGKHTATAVADKFFLFPNGEQKMTVEYEIFAADPSLCPQDATASVSIDKDATCFDSETVKLTLVNAKLDEGEVLSQEVGNQSVKVVSLKDHLFKNGTDRATVNYTVKDKQDDASCHNGGIDTGAFGSFPGVTSNGGFNPALAAFPVAAYMFLSMLLAGLVFLVIRRKETMQFMKSKLGAIGK